MALDWMQAILHPPLPPLHRYSLQDIEQARRGPSTAASDVEPGLPPTIVAPPPPPPQPSVQAAAAAAATAAAAPTGATLGAPADFTPVDAGRARSPSLLDADSAAPPAKMARTWATPQQPLPPPASAAAAVPPIDPVLADAVSVTAAATPTGPAEQTSAAAVASAALPPVVASAQASRRSAPVPRQSRHDVLDDGDVGAGDDAPLPAIVTDDPDSDDDGSAI